MRLDSPRRYEGHEEIEPRKGYGKRAKSQMDMDKQRQEYLDKLKEAEANAAKSTDSTESAAWVLIAEGYRALAKEPRS